MAADWQNVQIRRARLDYQVCIQCAPVLKGLKVSNIVILNHGSEPLIRNSLKGSKVSCIPFYVGERTEILMLYRSSLMKARLEEKDAAAFLRSCGFRHLDFPSVVMEFRRRYLDFDCGKRSFPHELGILLGYPVEDVRDFILHQGKDYLLSGHWKVYHNPEHARMTFQQYDNARKTAVRQILSGLTLKEVALFETI